MECDVELLQAGRQQRPDWSGVFRGHLPEQVLDQPYVNPVADLRIPATKCLIKVFKGRADRGVLFAVPHPRIQFIGEALKPEIVHSGLTRLPERRVPSIRARRQLGMLKSEIVVQICGVQRWSP